jgi:ketosteroid isomerase-like protein
MKYLLLLSLLIAPAIMAQEPDSSSAIFGMREAERNFAKASMAIGRNSAFAEYFAEKSLLFTDRWITNGKQYSRERKPSPVALKWEPEFMDIAASGDFGVSTGPWEVQEYRPNTLPLATGYFLTVWKKEPGGQWRVILDGGSETPVTKNLSHKFSFPGEAGKIAENHTQNAIASSEELAKVEKQLMDDRAKNPDPAVYTRYLAPNPRIQLKGHLPTTDRDSIVKFISGLNKSMVWKSSGSETASSGDMGFTYGTLLTNGDSNSVRGHFVRIWRKQPVTGWKIMIEMINPD